MSLENSAANNNQDRFMLPKYKDKNDFKNMGNWSKWSSWSLADLSLESF